jgi:hypothetical protein
MFDPDEPIKLEDVRRMRAIRAARSSPVAQPSDRRTSGSRLGLAIASVVDGRRRHDWAWLDQDESRHQP